MRKATFDECYEDNITGLKARLRNYWIESQVAIANDTLSLGTLENFIVSAFAVKGYAYEAAMNFIQELKEGR
jgi:hypothetical protein